MIIPAGTRVEIHTTNGGFARGRTWGSTRVLGSSDGLVVCGGVSLANRQGEHLATIDAYRIQTLEICDAG